jgi:hypothetical protein
MKTWGAGDNAKDVGAIAGYVVAQGVELASRRRGDELTRDNTARASTKVEEDVVPITSHRIGLERLRAWKSQRLSGADVEGAGMKRTLHNGTVEKALAQRSLAMGTDILRGVELAIYVVDGDWRSPRNRHLSHFARRYLANPAREHQAHRRPSRFALSGSRDRAAI